MSTTISAISNSPNSMRTMHNAKGFVSEFQHENTELSGQRQLELFEQEAHLLRPLAERVALILAKTTHLRKKAKSPCPTQRTVSMDLFSGASEWDARQTVERDCSLEAEADAGDQEEESTEDHSDNESVWSGSLSEATQDAKDAQDVPLPSSFPSPTNSLKDTSADLCAPDKIALLEQGLKDEKKARLELEADYYILEARIEHLKSTVDAFLDPGHNARHQSSSSPPTFRFHMGTSRLISIDSNSSDLESYLSPSPCASTPEKHGGSKTLDDHKAVFRTPYKPSASASIGDGNRSLKRKASSMFTPSTQYQSTSPFKVWNASPDRPPFKHATTEPGPPPNMANSPSHFEFVPPVSAFISPTKRFKSKSDPTV